MMKTGARRKLKTASGIAAGLGFSVMGGGLTTEAAANTLDAPLQKEVNNDVLANKDSVGIELTDSTSATEEVSTSESTSESTTEAQSEIESRADMGIMWTDGWNGNTYTLTFARGDLAKSGTSDYSQASGTMTFVLNANGTATMSVNISGITASVQNVFGLYLQTDNGVIAGWAGSNPAPLLYLEGV